MSAFLMIVSICVGFFPGSHGAYIYNQVDGQVNFIEAVIHQQQKGILRPNCKDSLDRTNLACFCMLLSPPLLESFAHAWACVITLNQ